MMFISCRTEDEIVTGSVEDTAPTRARPSALTKKVESGSKKRSVAVKPRKPDKPARDPNENVASKIGIVRVVLDEKPEPGNRARGTWLHVTWRNNTGRPIREVWAIATVTDDHGNPLSAWDSYEICLYAKSAPVQPGKTHTSHKLVQSSPSFDDVRPARAVVAPSVANEKLGEMGEPLRR